MRNLILIFAVLTCLPMMAQKKMVDAYVIDTNNNRYEGQVKLKNYLLKKSTTLFKQDQKVRFRTLGISEFGLCRPDSGFTVFSASPLSRFLIKKTDGEVILYQTGTNQYAFSKANELPILNGFKTTLKYYCDDYPNFRDTVDYISEGNIVEFINDYNDWREVDSTSQSSYDTLKYSHYRINFKISPLFPSIGIEFKLSEKFTLNSTINSSYGFITLNQIGIKPMMINQIRYYHNFEKRKERGFITQKHSGNFLAVSHNYVFGADINAILLEIGNQASGLGPWYGELSVGLGATLQNFPSIAFSLKSEFGLKLSAF